MYFGLLADFANLPFSKKHGRFETKYAKPTRREIILVAELNAIPIELLTTELE